MTELVPMITNRNFLYLVYCVLDILRIINDVTILWDDMRCLLESKLRQIALCHCIRPRSHVR